MSRSLRHVFSFLPLAVATCALVALPTGCEPIGCFRASEAGGSCPPKEEALPFFGDPGCGGEVASVNGDPSIVNGEPEEGTLCCYAITNKDPEFDACPDL